MKMLIATIALALGACTVGTAPPSTGVVAKADTVILTGERAFAAAELVYTAAADATGKLVDRGLIRGATATKVRGWNATARDLLVRGKATADTAEKARLAAQLFTISGNLNAAGGK